MNTRASLDDDRENREDVVSADTAVDLRMGADQPDAPKRRPLEKRRTGYEPVVTPDSIEQVETDPVPHDEGFALRYATSDLLGEGGMGEVRLARDARIGREVAMKVVRAGQGSRSDMRSRFLREARVQGQLEHPAIVPVYDLGARPDGAAFFTMKRVRGQTLEEILDDLRAKEPAALNEFSRRKLLSAFGSVCLAIDFAHARGVVHRDLKPGNIMLGGFGEVYVLDWGLAKIKDDANPLSGRESESVDAPVSIRGQTEAGAVMGTPGYMAPEQLVTTEVDARADVYALGSILFEMVVGRPLHNKPKLAQILDSTLTGPETRAALVAPSREIPPELEAIWTKAIALNKEDRFASARELNDEIERFLDGDRDLERRRQMADEHVRRGEELSAKARDDGGMEDRKAAMQELGRALALDPSNAAAVHAMSELLAEPPNVLPSDTIEEMADAEMRNDRVSARAAAYAYSAWLLFAPLLILAGVREMGTLIGLCSCTLIAAACGFIAAGRPEWSKPMRWIIVSFTAAAIAMGTRIFSPLLLVPALAISNTIGFAMTRARRERFFVALLGTASVAIPILLERTGVISPTFAFENGTLVIFPRMISFDHPIWVNAFLIIAHVSLMATTLAYVGTVREHAARYERHSLLQAWHFRQLAPEQARIKAQPPAHPCAVENLRTKRDATTR